MDEEKKNALREKLNAIHIWPSVYMYKFIFETNHDKLIQIQTIFGESAQFIKRESANGKYTSLTIKEMMLDADSIFARYEQMAAVPGIISL
jgi:putative lipoic acid-binding regulatory protein